MRIQMSIRTTTGDLDVDIVSKDVATHGQLAAADPEVIEILRDEVRLACRKALAASAAGRSRQ